MAPQSSITVTPENPSPPTNFTTVFLGQTPPNSPAQTVVDDGAAGTLTVFGANRASVDNTNFPSVPHEAAGTEVTVVAPGSRVEAPTVSMSVLGNYTIAAELAARLQPVAGYQPGIGLNHPDHGGVGTDRHPACYLHRHRLYAGLPDLGQQPGTADHLCQRHVDDGDRQ